MWLQDRRNHKSIDPTDKVFRQIGRWIGERSENGKYFAKNIEWNNIIEILPVTQDMLHRGFRGMPGTSIACKFLIGGLESAHEIPNVAYTQHCRAYKTAVKR